jgi:transposase
MVMQNYTHSQVGDILQVSVGFVNKWKYAFLEDGIAGLKLKHKGSRMLSDTRTTPNSD